MLEIRHLSKIYKTKNHEVHALDDINLRIQDKGMVFILGKSGSGKSTLLNVLGGLDRFDDGEIVICGKSSKDFKQSDFDSYRNTFIGFIFQEYNVMDNFTVKENIALALQLQGKKADKERVEEILKEVDLEGLGNRKPNELSGGQLQRVAIARALIKKPEIIMADEPTGALDSRTGKQVFDTLKKLSMDKLVLIVSHDKEFAKHYADRIIELADGRIVNDTSKDYAKPTEMKDGVAIVEDAFINVRDTKQLKEEDLKLLIEEIKKHQGEMIISFHQDTNKEIRKANHIAENGMMEVFHQTEERHVHMKDYTKHAVSFIKSKLPFTSSMRLALSNLKVKKFRLFMTILLSVVSFTLFGISDTMTRYDRETATLHSVKDSKIDYLSIGKKAVFDFDGYKSENSINLTDEDVEKLQKMYPDASFSDTFSQNNLGTVLDTSAQISETEKYYEGGDASVYPSSLSALSVLDNDVIKKNGFALDGHLPQKKSEIVVTRMYADTFVRYGYQWNDEKGEAKKEKLSAPKDLIGKRLSLTVNGKTEAFTVCGILDTKADLSRYQSEQDAQEGIMNYYLSSELQTLQNSSYHTLGFINKDLFQSYVKDYKVYGSDALLTISLNIGNDYFDAYQFYRAADMDSSRLVDFHNGGEIYADYSMLRNVKINENMTLNDYVMNNLTSSDEKETIRVISEAVKRYQKEIENSKYTIDVFSQYSNDGYVQLEGKLGGVYIGDLSSADMSGYGNSVMVVSDAFLKQHGLYKQGHASFLVSPMSGDDTLKAVIADTYSDAKQHYALESQVMPMLETVNSMVDVLAPVFFYMGIGFALFAAVLFCNFIATSIANKKREIGILRAVGARGIDVLKIFLNESLMIALINWIFAVIVCIAIAGFFNGYIREEFHVLVTILNFGIVQILLLLALAIGVAFIASALPVYSISHKKPIDAIKNRK